MQEHGERSSQPGAAHVPAAVRAHEHERLGQAFADNKGMLEDVLGALVHRITSEG